MRISRRELSIVSETKKTGKLTDNTSKYSPNGYGYLPLMNLMFQLRSFRRGFIQSVQLRYARIATWIPEVYPDFMCIGAPRAATTWLYTRLRSDPQVFLPKIKELHFFDEKREADYDDRSGLLWRRSFYFDMLNPAHWRWYSMQFLKGGSKKKGDITPVYSLLSLERVRLIVKRMPDIKVIYILRNPVDRAWSGMRKSIWYQKGKCNKHYADQHKLLNTVMHPEMLERGNYRKAIETWGGVVPEKNMLYLFYDDIVNDQELVLEKIHSFIGLESPGRREPRVEKRRVNAAPGLDMPVEIRRELEKYYDEQIRYLESRFNRNLSHWRGKGEGQ